LWNGDEEVASLMRRFNAACAAAPHTPRPKIMLLAHTYVGTDEADLQRAAKELSVYYNYFLAWFKNERPICQALIAPLSDEELTANPQVSPEVMRTNLPVGTPEQVIVRLKSFEAMGYDEYAMWIDTGMSFERKKASLERFIAGVMPAFAG
jgi:alkanesulfonate monooxygenase SsuD/methylene tetrahydromethanopterin reductase-like flavin-dependent oxidoreductase (luciferase family)